MPSVNVSHATTSAVALVPAPGAGLYIRVLGYCLTAAGPVTVNLRSNTTDRLGVRLVDGATAVAPPTDNWEIDCAVNEPLNLKLDAAVAVTGHVTYRVIG